MTAAPPRFRPAWWLRNPHLQTLWAASLRRAPGIRFRRERLETPDADFLDLDWIDSGPLTSARNEAEREAPGARGASHRSENDRPVVVVLHGLEGSSRSRYARGMLAACAARGWRGVVLHFRGCSGEANRRDRGYHSGETTDLAHVVEVLRRRGDGPIAAVGYSLGGNVLLKWLGETGGANPLRAAAAVSVPMLLGVCADRLEVGFSRVYQAWLMRSMRAAVARKFAARAAPFDLGRASRARTFREFDDAVTAPLHGFAGVDDYYARSSARQFLGGIAVPTLIVHALDDPFMTDAVVPSPAELPAAVRLEASPGGGHVGFVTGDAPWAPRYWLEERVPAFLDGFLGA